ncbi:hypothetical protein BaRGS_00013699 [Batillaria attramentaria]|uniref:Uncharacterized protein n=1 Tax=Batillaria attramentaria TaxID=370345 RepID=A0ABD0L626_9CAEN
MQVSQCSCTKLHVSAWFFPRPFTVRALSVLPMIIDCAFEPQFFGTAMKNRCQADARRTLGLMASTGSPFWSGHFILVPAASVISYIKAGDLWDPCGTESRAISRSWRDLPTTGPGFSFPVPGECGPSSNHSPDSFGL